jgi:heptosyltransferase-2
MSADRLLIVQTAFPGDVILTIPLAEAAAAAGYAVDMLTTPDAAPLLAGHPSIRRIVAYDKRRSDSGVRGFIRIARTLRASRYDAALIPHRSVRSGALALAAGIPVRLGFDVAAGRIFYTARARYEHHRHEILRNLSLLDALRPATGADRPSRPLRPGSLHISGTDFQAAAELAGPGRYVAIAPGTQWTTKRWPAAAFADLLILLRNDGVRVVLAGGPADLALCEDIAADQPEGAVVNAAGKLTFTGSAALISRAALLVCNDSAPLHIANAVGTPVVAIFGATSPSFGFGPVGPRDAVVETPGLICRPCAIHGGDVCPVGTFECMRAIRPERVHREVMRILGGR